MILRSKNITKADVEMGLLNTFDMLEELLAQNQFELLPPNEEKEFSLFI